MYDGETLLQESGSTFRVYDWRQGGWHLSETHQMLVKWTWASRVSEKSGNKVCAFPDSLCILFPPQWENKENIIFSWRPLSLFPHSLTHYPTDRDLSSPLTLETNKAICWGVIGGKLPESLKGTLRFRELHLRPWNLGTCFVVPLQGEIWQYGAATVVLRATLCGICHILAC